MTDTFSPGPWTVIPHPDKDCGARGIVTQEAVDQATAFNDDAFSSAHTTCYLNAEANARLIADAPNHGAIQQRRHPRPRRLPSPSPRSFYRSLTPSHSKE